MCFYRDIIPAKIVSVDGQFYELRTTDTKLTFTVHKSMLPSHNPKKGDEVGLKLTKLGSRLLVKKCFVLNEQQQDKHIRNTELVAGEVVDVNFRKINISTFNDAGDERIVHFFPKRNNRCPSVSKGDPVLAEVTEKKGRLIASSIRNKPIFVKGTKRETTGRIPSRK